MKTDVHEIEHIKEMLPLLSETFLREMKDFTQYLLEKQKKRREFEDEVLNAKRGPFTECHTIDEVMQAIRNSPDNEDY